MSSNPRPALVLGDIGIAGLEALPSVQIHKGSLSFDGNRIALPAGRLNVADAIASGTAGDWNIVVDWLFQRMTPGQVLIVAYDHLLRDLAAIGAARGLFDYALAWPTAPKRIVSRDYEMIGSAAFCLFADAEVEAGFRRIYVPPYTGVQASSGLEGLAKAAMARRAAGNATPLTARTAPIRVLLVAYFSGPARTVGVQRINYWREAIPRLDPDIHVTVATAMQGDDAHPDIRVIPDHGAAALMTGDGTVPGWGSAFIDSEKQNARYFSTLSHYWRIALEQYFDATDDHFDVVIISGNPFAVFDFSAYAKRRWYARVILDYRDPFANNPRMAYTPEARDWARYIEKGYNLQADLVTVVNDACAGMVEAYEDVDVQVIPNGFDDAAIAPAGQPWSDDDGLVHFVHAGTFFHDRSPQALIRALDPDRHKLHHIGSLNGIDPEDRNSKALVNYGTLPYIEVSEKISRADCGVVFVSETGFETPTKLYDYLAYGIDVVIVTHGVKEGSSIADILGNIDGVYWVSNTPEALAEFISSYQPSRIRRSDDDIYKFSRKSGANALIESIRNLCDKGEQ